MRVARRDVAIEGSHADHRPVEILIEKADAAKHGAIRGAAGPAGGEEAVMFGIGRHGVFSNGKLQGSEDHGIHGKKKINSLFFSVFSVYSVVLWFLSQLRGSPTSSTFFVCSTRNCRSASLTLGYLFASIAAASRAALVAPGLPMASVPTGMPAGICTVDKSESMPCSAFDSIGTPRTGSMVLAAMTPARWAAPPAPAMSTSSPRVSAVAAHS